MPSDSPALPGAWYSPAELARAILPALVVATVGLPMSLAIAEASGFPAVAGVLAAIISGWVQPFIGGSYITISGPAAALSPVLARMGRELGGGRTGLQRVHGIIFITGLLQLIIPRLAVRGFRLTRLSHIFSERIVEAMLAVIGAIMVVKKLPDFLGQHFAAHEVLEILAELPQRVSAANPRILLVGAASLIVMLTVGRAPVARGRGYIPILSGTISGALLGIWLHLEPEYRVKLPAQIFVRPSVPPLAALFAGGWLTWRSLLYIVQLTAIDSIESVATVTASEGMDPYRRRTDPNRTLCAMGVANLISAAFQGPTNIPGGVKTRAAVDSGARSRAVNFLYGNILLAYLLLFPRVIEALPLTTLAAVLIYIGGRMLFTRAWQEVCREGRGPFVIFISTFAVTFATDLLPGIGAGLSLELLFALWRAAPRSEANMGPLRRVRTALVRVWQSPVTVVRLASGAVTVRVIGALSCFSMVHLAPVLHGLGPSDRAVEFDLTGVSFADQTPTEALRHTIERLQHGGASVSVRQSDVDIVHLEQPVTANEGLDVEAVE